MIKSPIRPIGKRETDLFGYIWCMKINNTLGNNGLTKEFSEGTFWSELKTPSMKSINLTFNSKTLCVS